MHSLCPRLRQKPPKIGQRISQSKTVRRKNLLLFGGLCILPELLDAYHHDMSLASRSNLHHSDSFLLSVFWASKHNTQKISEVFFNRASPKPSSCLQKQAFHGSPQLSSRFSVVLHGSLLFSSWLMPSYAVQKPGATSPTSKSGSPKAGATVDGFGWKKGREAQANLAATTKGKGHQLEHVRDS